jgi:hypothetical protein
MVVSKGELGQLGCIAFKAVLEIDETPKQSKPQNHPRRENSGIMKQLHYAVPFRSAKDGLLYLFHR